MKYNKFKLIALGALVGMGFCGKLLYDCGRQSVFEDFRIMIEGAKEASKKTPK